MKIVDFNLLGNVVVLQCGTDKQFTDSWGDDWDDRPYEDNAGSVYEEYVSEKVQVAFKENYVILEPANQGGGSWYSKEDLKNRKAPALVIYRIPDEEYRWEYDLFSRVVNLETSIKIYLGDDIDEVKKKLEKEGTIL